MTGVDYRTEGGDIALKSEAKDGMELEKSGEQGGANAEQGKAKQNKAKHSKQSESNRASHTETRSRGRLRLADWAPTLRDRTGRDGAQDTWLEKF